MSWVETPPGIDQPTSTTYERWRKRNIQKFNRYWKDSHTSSSRRSSQNIRLEERAKELGHVNRLHQRWMKQGKFNGRKWKMMAMPALRHLSRAEINYVKAKAKKSSTGKGGD